MNGYEFAARLVDALAWPVAVVVAVIVLRPALAGVLAALGRRLRSASAGGVTFDFAEEQITEDVRKSANEILAAIQGDAEKARRSVDELISASIALGAVKSDQPGGAIVGGSRVMRWGTPTISGGSRVSGRLSNPPPAEEPGASTVSSAP